MSKLILQLVIVLAYIYVQTPYPIAGLMCYTYKNGYSGLYDH